MMSLPVQGGERLPFGGWQFARFGTMEYHEVFTN